MDNVISIDRKKPASKSNAKVEVPKPIVLFYFEAIKEKMLNVPTPVRYVESVICRKNGAVTHVFENPTNPSERISFFDSVALQLVVKACLENGRRAVRLVYLGKNGRSHSFRVEDPVYKRVLLDTHCFSKQAQG